MKVKVIGIGGAGTRAVSFMNSEWGNGPELAGVHSDVDRLQALGLAQIVAIGEGVKEQGSMGGNVAAAGQMAEQDAAKLSVLSENFDVVMLTTGLGGGTGSGVVPVVARCAKENGAFCIAFVSMPFDFEGESRKRTAFQALQKLREHADAVILVPNQQLISAAPDTPMVEAFERSTQRLAGSIHALWCLLLHRGVIQIDLGDIREMVRHADSCKLMYGEAKGENRIEELQQRLENDPLVQTGHWTGHGQKILVGICGGNDLTLAEVEAVMGHWTERIGPNADVITGVSVDQEWEQRIGAVLLTAEVDDDLQEQSDSQQDHAEDSNEASGTEKKKKSPRQTRPRRKNLRQSKLELSPTGKGKFKDVEPTIYDGEDLDIPAFLRKGIQLPK